MAVLAPKRVNELAAGGGVLPTDLFVGGRANVLITFGPSAIAASVLSSLVAKTVQLATTANITLSGEQTIGGVLTSASRVLVKDQTLPRQNGIYVSAAGAWARAADMDTWPEVIGSMVSVQQGTVNADTIWLSTSDLTGGILGTTDITFVQFAGAQLWQPYDVGLGALAVFNTNGFIVQTANNVYVARTLTATSPVVVAGGGGLSSNPLFSLDVSVDFAFTAAQNISLANTSSAQTVLGLTSTDAGAFGITFDYFFNTASALAADMLARTTWRGRNSTPATITYSTWTVTETNVTAAAEQVQHKFTGYVAGTNSQIATLGPGYVGGSPTGGDKGIGTGNFVAAYDDNVLLTCQPLAEEFLTEGRIDLDKWDAMVPELVTPELRWLEPVTREVVIPVLRERKEGGLVRVYEKRFETVKELMPVFNKRGHGIDAIEQEVTQEIIVPEKREKRPHKTAHLFDRMVKDGFDPRDPMQYIAKMRADQALPGMPSQDDWEHSALSLGEIHSRLWLAVDMLALCMAGVIDRHNDLAARVDALEDKG